MPGKVLRVTDKNTMGAPILDGVSSVRINGLPVATEGSPLATHGNGRNKRPDAKMLPGSNSRVRANGKPISVVDDKDTCNHPVLIGSPNVKIGG